MARKHLQAMPARIVLLDVPCMLMLVVVIWECHQHPRFVMIGNAEAAVVDRISIYAVSSVAGIRDGHLL